MIHIFLFACTFLSSMCNAQDLFNNAPIDGTVDTLTTSAVQMAEELVVAIRNKQDTFTHLIDQESLQALITTLEQIVSRAPRPSNGPCPAIGCQSWDCASLQSFLCTLNSCIAQIRQAIGCPCGPCCISDTCMGLDA